LSHNSFSIRCVRKASLERSSPNAPLTNPQPTRGKTLPAMRIALREVLIPRRELVGTGAGFSDVTVTFDTSYTTPSIPFPAAGTLRIGGKRTEISS